LLYIEDEHHANYTSTKDKATAWRDIEKRLAWTKPPRRYSDNDAQQIFDLNHDHDYPVTAISKRVTGEYAQNRLNFAESVINRLRVGLGMGKVKVSPKCKFLISTLRYGIWNERRTDFERSEELGHFDAGICLAYLYDNIAWTINPWPEEARSQEVFYPPDTERVKRVDFQKHVAKILTKPRRFKAR
jgi:hypothetical protein